MNRKVLEAGVSAIGGVIYPKEGGLDHNLAATMSNALRHRGEAADVILPDSGTAFFFRYHHCGIYQPGVTIADPIFVLADGRARVAGHGVLWGDALSDYIYSAYQENGADFLADLDGGFAVCIYDRSTRNVLLSRDMFARRPLYYAYQQGHFWFASEIKAILSDPLFKRSVNTASLAQQLTYRGNFGPETLFQDVFKVVPGFYVEGSIGSGDSEPSLELHFNLKTASVKKHRASAKYYEQSLWTNLCQNIRDQCNSGTLHAGLLMSGGIDSALIASAQPACGLTNTVAISCGYSDPDAHLYDETAMAQENAQRYGLSCQNVTIDAADDLLGLFRRTVFNTEEPPRTFISLSTARALEQFQGQLNVLMTGTCADILFGEQSLYDTPIYGLRKRCPAVVWKLFRRSLPLFRHIPKLRGYAAWVKRGDVASMKEYLLLNQRTNANLRGLTNSLVPETCAPHTSQIYEAIKGFAPEDEYTLVGTLMLAHCFNEMFEQIGSHNGVDIIHPFQSQSMYELSLQMPYRGKIARKHTKPYLRELAAKRYSKEFAYREKTRFSSPGTLWLRASSQLQEAAYQLAEPTARIGYYLDRHAIRGLVDEYKSELASGQLKQSTSQLIYTLIGLEIWLETFISKEQPAFNDQSLTVCG
jgi:asparagine synthase (glutamine-hydrolysing)